MHDDGKQMVECSLNRQLGPTLSGCHAPPYGVLCAVPCLHVQLLRRQGSGWIRISRPREFDFNKGAGAYVITPHAFFFLFCNLSLVMIHIQSTQPFMLDV